MPTFRRYAASLLAAVALTIGAVVLPATAAQADPQVIRCVHDVPDYYRYTSTATIFVRNPSLASTQYNSDNVPVNCLYKGEGFELFTGSTHWIEFGPSYFLSPNFEYI
jgi:hypothetical protein